MFQSTPPRGGRQMLSAVLGYSTRFNPRPRAGGDVSFLLVCVHLCFVSIHAPARGATIECVGISICCFVSIHAPARGATSSDKLRLSEEVEVSIHAPARGATTKVIHITPISISFNPRPRAGGDISPLSDIEPRAFQSTPPRGGRQVRYLAKGEVVGFQSTPPRGGRLIWLLHWNHIGGSFNPRPRAGGDNL